MKLILNWQPHRYGGGYTAQIVKGLSLTVSYSILRDDPTPYSVSGLGVTFKSKFKTSDEAKIAAEVYARTILTKAAKIFSCI